MSSNRNGRPFWRIVTLLAGVCLVSQTLFGACARAGVVFNGNVLDYQERQIYHSPETPGYTCWVGLWQTPNNGPIQCDFTQKTGPAGAPVTTFPVLQSSNDGQTWTSVAGNVPAGPCRGMAVLSDGTMVRPGANGIGYTQRSTDGGHTWDSPVYFVSTSQYRAWPTLMKPLSDGRLVLMAGTWLRDATNTPGENIQKTMFISSDQGKTWGPPITLMPLSVGNCEESDFVELPNGNLMWIHRASHANPDGSYAYSNRMESIVRKVGDTFVAEAATFLSWPHSGFPCELMTREGTILDLCSTGSHWSNDGGANWHSLKLNLFQSLKTNYYPQAVQTKDGTIVVISHVGGDDVYGAVDQAIYQQTFRLSTSIPEPSTPILLGMAAVGLLGYLWRRRRQRTCRKSGYSRDVKRTQL